MTITKRQITRVFSKLRKDTRGGCDCAKDAYVCAYIIAEIALNRKLDEIEETEAVKDAKD